MISRVTDPSVIEALSDSEAEVRIGGLLAAYGLSAPFLRFYQDEDGGVLSLMDGCAVLVNAVRHLEEWAYFLSMQPEIRLVRTDKEIGERLAAFWHCPIKTGQVLQWDGDAFANPLCPVERSVPHLEEVYGLLSSAFESFPAFDGWYVDMSHRLRHHVAHMAVMREDGRLVGHAATVAETSNAVLLGCVATHPDYRCRGIATNCLMALLQDLQQKTVLICPANQTAERLYRHIGFISCGAFTELNVPHSC